MWGGLLELQAAARVFDLRLIIFTTPLELPPFHLHGQQCKRILALRFNGRHYTTSWKARTTCCRIDIRDMPEQVPRRMRGGGGEDDASSVWTRVSASVWSRSSASSTSRPRPSSVTPATSAPRPSTPKRSRESSVASARAFSVASVGAPSVKAAASVAGKRACAP